MSSNDAAAASAATPPVAPVDNICRFCSEQHELMRCPYFKALTPELRARMIRTHGYCQNCLAMSHAAAECTSAFRCRKCGESHHTMLHKGEEPQGKRALPPPSRGREQQPTAPAAASRPKWTKPARKRGSAARNQATPVAAPPSRHRTIRQRQDGLQTATFRGREAIQRMSEAMGAIIWSMANS